MNPASQLRLAAATRCVQPIAYKFRQVQPATGASVGTPSCLPSSSCANIAGLRWSRLPLRQRQSGPPSEEMFASPVGCIGCLRTEHEMCLSRPQTVRKKGMRVHFVRAVSRRAGQKVFRGILNPFLSGCYVGTGYFFRSNNY